ncbi:type VI secretion system Vgr family protein [Marinibacterium sp. SX1]|uniref:type VI secretion system Vgr family protein n=1 Tax=Marinibacterium sp. SX1 TaxID=3388424 RepID=UPI003D16D9D2
MTVSKPHDDAIAWMSGDYGAQDLQFRKAIVREGMSRLTEMTVSFQSKTKDLDLTQFIGKAMKVHLKTQDKNEREFGGICVSVENLGLRAGVRQYVAEIRPWFYLLTRTRDCRVFQNLTTRNIVEQIFGEYGFTDFTFKLSDSYDVRQYCVQYRESDFAFISRLLEQEGIYYFFGTKSGSAEPDQLTFCDSKSSHSPVPELAKVPFEAMTNASKGREEKITEWAATRAVTSGKVTLNDYDLFKPTASMVTTEAAGSRQFPRDDMEIYDYPGRFRGEGNTPKDKPVTSESDRAQRRARVRLEAETIRHKTWRGASSVRTMGVGHSFALTDHPDSAANTDYLVIRATHYVQTDMDVADEPTDYDLRAANLDFPEGIADFAYAATIETIALAEPYRAPLSTPWPMMSGLQTALVVGPSGEEIYTDDYGRIRVQFHWDREGKKDETSSCWVRVATPWAGKNWGFAAVPRIGEEVIIQFEEGDPSRPICVGMLYNEVNPTFYSKKTTATQVGIRTDSTKGVNDAQAFNELMFDDEKDKEMMRLQAQKDHQFLTKNISRIGVGLAKADELKDYAFKNAADASLLQVVKANMEQEVQEGDAFFYVTKGSQEKVIHKDFKTTVETGDTLLDVVKGKLLETIKDNHETTVQSGNQTNTVEKGNQTIAIDTGNQTTTVKKGNIAVTASLGKIEIEAKQKIVLKVGQSSITIDMSGVTIDAPMVDVKAKGMATVDSKMTTVKGAAMLTLKGGITMIN